MSVSKLVVDFDNCITNIYKVGSGMVLSEPTVAAVFDDEKNTIKAIGNDAKKLIGKTSNNTKIIFPVFEGEIVNEKVAKNLLDGFFKKINEFDVLSKEILFPIPCGATTEMIEKFYNVGKNCGAKKVYFVEIPILSILGQGIPLNDSNPCFVIDISGGTTNIAAVSLDGVIAGVSVNFGANKISMDIIDYVAEKYGLQIGLLTAERLRNEIGSLESEDALSIVVNGRDISTGQPKSISIKAMDIVEPIKNYFDKIIEIAVSVLQKLPPEVSAEVRHSGVYISGLVSSIYGLSDYFYKRFNTPIKIAEDSQYSVALGGGVVMGNEELIKKVCKKY